LALTLDGAGGDTIRNTTGFSITNGAQIAISGNTVMTLTGSAVQGVYAWSTKLRDAVPSQITFTTADITITGTGASNTATAFVAEYGANIIISDSAKITVTGDTAMGVKAAATNSDYYPTGVVLNNTVMTVTGDTVGVGIYGYGGSSTNSAVVTANNSSITSSHVGIRHTNGLLTVNLTGTTMVSNGDVAFEVTDGTLPKLPAKLIVNADNSTFNGVSNYTVTDADSDPATTSFFNLNMSNNSTWTIPGDSRLTNLALNDSTLRFSARNDGMFTTLTLDGDFSGTGGTIYLNTKLDDDASPTDLIHIKGNSSGAATLHVANAGGSGALTSGDGIKVVDVEGTSGAVLTLAGDYQTDDGKEAVVAGAYGYTLEQGGVADANDGDWYLRSRAAPKPPDNGGNNDNNNGGATHTGGVTPAPAPATPAAPVAPALRYQPFVPMAEAYATVLSEGIMNMESFHQRIGGRFIVNSGATAVTGSILPSNASGYAPVAVSADLPGLQPVAAPTDDEGRPLFMWADVRGSRATFKPDKSTTGVASTANDWQIRSGFDAMLYDKDESHLLAGLNVFYGGAAVDAKSVHGNGSLDIRRYGLGATMTWFNDSGTYVDLHGRAVWFDTDIKADALGPLANKAKAFGWAASAEVGHTFRITPSFSLTPQAQLIYGTVNFKDITDRFNNRYEFDDNTSLRGRVGVEAAYTTSRFNAAGEYSETRLYSTLNLYHEFSNKRKLKVANVAVGNERERNWGGLALGVSHTWKNGRFRIFGEVEAMSSINGRRSHAVTGRIGFAVRF
jgi:outer membrane autotransporter protein